MVAKRIGELLMEANVVTSEQLEYALRAQQSDGRKLGHVLIDLDMVTELELTQTLSRQLSIPWVSLYHVDLSRQLLGLIQKELAERYNLIPIFMRRVRKQGDTLYVAMDDPTNDAALQEVGRAVGLPVRPMIACSTDIRNAIRVHYFGESTAGSSVVTIPAAPSAQPQVPPPPAMPVPPPRPSSPSATANQEKASASPPMAVVAGSAHGAVGPSKRPTVPDTTTALAKQAQAAQAQVGLANGEHAVAASETSASEPANLAKRKPRTTGPMMALTFLDGTKIQIPSGKGRASSPDLAAEAKAAEAKIAEARGEGGKPGEGERVPPSGHSELTGRDLLSALRALVHGADASDMIGETLRWEKMFAALLTLMFKKGLITEQEFIDEYKKV